jgi:hypothetical protein
VVAISGIDFQAGSPPGIIWALDCDFPGDDIQELKTQAVDCGQACRAERQCSHFVHNNNRKICFLKRKKGLTKNDAFVVGSEWKAICGIDCSSGSQDRFGTKC